MGAEDALYQVKGIGAVKDVELGGILVEDMGEGELLNGTTSVVRGMEGDVSGSGRGGIGGGRLDCNEAVRGGDESGERT